MTDWKSMVQALGLNIPEQNLESTVAPLDSLEAAFHNAAAGLASGQELAVTFDPAPEEDSAR